MVEKEAEVVATNIPVQIINVFKMSMVPILNQHVIIHVEKFRLPLYRNILVIAIINVSPTLMVAMNLVIVTAIVRHQLEAPCPYLQSHCQMAPQDNPTLTSCKQQAGLNLMISVFLEGFSLQ